MHRIIGAFSSLAHQLKVYWTKECFCVELNILRFNYDIVNFLTIVRISLRVQKRKGFTSTNGKDETKQKSKKMWKLASNNCVMAVVTRTKAFKTKKYPQKFDFYAESKFFFPDHHYGRHRLNLANFFSHHLAFYHSALTFHHIIWKNSKIVRSLCSVLDV